MPHTNSIVLATAQIDDDGHQWIEVIPTADKARNGRWYFTITRADLDTYAASISAASGLIPIDYDHDGADGGSTVAAGWFTGETAIVEAGGTTPAGGTQEHTSLWARVKWTPQAVQEIQDGRFKRLSPEFDFKERDAKTGLLTKAKDIIASTLTNRPFFGHLAPVAAAGEVLWDDSTGFMALMDEVNEALNGDDPSMPWRYYVVDVAADRALVRESAGDDAWVIPFTTDDQGEVQLSPVSEWMPAEQQWVQAAMAALETFNSARGRNRKENDMDPMVVKSLGLPEDATPQQVVTAIEARNAELEELKATAGDKTELEQLRADLDAERTLRVTAERETVLADAVRERQVTPAQGEVLAEKFGEDVGSLKAVLATFPKQPAAARGTGGDANDDGDIDLDPVTIQGTVYDVEEDGAKAHAKALEILDAAGKAIGYSAEDYVAALERAGKELAAA